MSDSKKYKYGILWKFYRGDGQPGLIPWGIEIKKEEYDKCLEAIKEGKSHVLIVSYHEASRTKTIERYPLEGERIHSVQVDRIEESNIILSPDKASEVKTKSGIIMPPGSVGGANDAKVPIVRN